MKATVKMPLVDFTKLDGRIELTADRRRGVWASQTIVYNAKSVRTAGQAPASTSAHGLLTLALINALKNISKRMANRSIHGRLVTKTRLQIVTTDATFADALRALMAGDKSTMAAKPFRAGRNFLMMLAKELSRFDVTLETDAEDETYRFRALSNWAQLHVRDPREIEKLPAILSPVAVAHII